MFMRVGQVRPPDAPRDAQRVAPRDRSQVFDDLASSVRPRRYSSDDEERILPPRRCRSRRPPRCRDAADPPRRALPGRSAARTIRAGPRARTRAAGFSGHRAHQRKVAALIDHPHRAAPDLADDLVASDGSREESGHSVQSRERFLRRPPILPSLARRFSRSPGLKASNSRRSHRVSQYT